MTQTTSVERIAVEMRVRRLATSVLRRFAALEEALRADEDVGERREEIAIGIEDLATMCELLPRTHALRWSADDAVLAHQRWATASARSDAQRALHVDLVIALAMLRRAIEDDVRLAA